MLPSWLRKLDFSMKMDIGAEQYFSAVSQVKSSGSASCLSRSRKPNDRQIRREKLQTEISNAPRENGRVNFFEGIFVSQSDESLKELEAFTKGTETMKFASLYCDFYGVVAQAPSELIPEKLATEVLKLAKNRVKHFRANVRPKLDQVLKIDPKEIEHFRNEFLRTMADAKSDVDC